MGDGFSTNYTCTYDFQTLDVFLGFALTIGILISFIPQIIVLLVNKNVEGLSVLSCCFNFANCMCNFLNILFLDWFVFDCCEDMNSWTCFRNLLPMMQMLSPFISTFIIFMLYTIYRPRLPPRDEYKRQIAAQNAQEQQQQDLSSGSESSPPGSPRETTSILSTKDRVPSLLSLNNSIQVSDAQANGDGFMVDSNQPDKHGSADSFISDHEAVKKNSTKNYVADESLHLKQGKNKVEKFFIKMDWYSQPFFWANLAFTIVFFVIGLAIALEYGGKEKSLHVYAVVLGILASILVFFQWLPQIYTTWISQEIGSLSVVSLCIQAPGSVLVVIFQWNQNWSTWFPYLATAIQAFVLIGICVYFMVRDRKKRKAAEKLEKERKLAEEQNAQYYQSSNIVEVNNE